MFRYADNSWIIPDRLLASVRPESMRYIKELKMMGVSSVLNLTEEEWPRKWIDDSGLDYLHIAVDDFGTPSLKQTTEAVRFIKERISKGAVMVHCRAGLGRTGTIIGVYLVETGMDPEEAIDTVRERRPGSLEVESQEKFVRTWKRRG